MKTKYFAMIAAAMVLASCGGKQEANNQGTIAEELPQVKIAQVENVDVPQTEQYTAIVESEIKNNISPNAPRRIEKILCEVGDHVTKGQVLVELDKRNLDQLKYQIDNMLIEFNRVEQLFNIGGVSKSEYDNMKTQVDVLRSQYAQLEENTRLIAPISGVVTARNYDNGDMFGAMPVLTIEQTNPVKMLCNVSEDHYKDVKVGQSVDIELDAYEGEHFNGRVTIVYPTINAATHTFPVEVTINNDSQKVRPGMFARATINYGSKNHVVVPDEALVKQIGAGDRYVYVFNADSCTVSYNRVELGRHLDDKYEIISGVNPGDYIVIAGQARLANGRKVEVVE
ncbi:MAG: efflux RND transporter periplasmic adaptor subunit [Muribaculaceae bacterium]|nr:efflux RND transporter periplasmic adaptor subunit [Muribaculaceae bacterium]